MCVTGFRLKYEEQVRAGLQDAAIFKIPTDLSYRFIWQSIANCRLADDVEELVESDNPAVRQRFRNRRVEKTTGIIANRPGEKRLHPRI